MAPWRDHIRHTLLSQERKRREETFRRPQLSDVLEVLRNGPPVSAADLFALAGDYLDDIADDIRNGSSDGYMIFWNPITQWEVGEPLPEEICRDRLKERLRVALQPHGLAVERESDVADHKRADLRILFGAHAIPVECKRHYSDELWTAIADQLILRYTRDPDSGGFGIYCVLWFGLDEKPIPKPPAGIEQPRTAGELATALRKTIPDGHEDQTKVICIDVSRPSR